MATMDLPKLFFPRFLIALLGEDNDQQSNEELDLHPPL